MTKLLVLQLLFFSSVAFCQEIEFILKKVECLSIDSDGKYEYRMRAALRNATDREITLQTGLFTTSINSFQGAPDEFVFGPTMVHRVKDVHIIPGITDFRLVELKPGEAAGISFMKKTKLSVKTARIVYSISDEYSERFGFWNGSVKSDYIDVYAFNDCRL